MKKHKKISAVLFLTIIATGMHIIKYKPYLPGTYETEDKSAVLVIMDKSQGFSDGKFFVNNETVKCIHYFEGNEFEFFDIVNQMATLGDSISFRSNIFTQKITFTYDGVEYSFKKVGSPPSAI